ncbi:MAG: hypothetical protein EOO90_26690 [Pedobacter sp.]|nr:MAG: hypothetical protein EOO90_26690 [Pedobacter sp.]
MIFVCRGIAPFLAISNKLKSLLSLVLLAFLFSVQLDSYAQTCTNKNRVYANFQDVQLGAGDISNRPNAIDTDPSTASRLQVSSFLSVSSTTQYLEFTTDGTHGGKKLIQTGTPVTIKVTIPSSALALNGTLEIGSFTGLNTISKSAVRTSLYSNSNLGVLSGNGAVEIELVPGQDYNGLYVQLSAAILAIDVKVDVFGAYILEENPNAAECDQAIDVLSGISGTGLLSSLGTVSNIYNAIDVGANHLNTFATISSGLLATNETYLVAIFNKPSQPLDSIKIVYDGGGGLNILSGFNIQPYLGSTAAGGSFTAANVTVKPIAGTTKFELSFPVAVPFDRVRISYGGLLTIGASLNIYDVTRVIPRPITLIDGQFLTSKEICFGSVPTLSIGNVQNCTTYSWYENETSTTPLKIGQIYQPGVLSVGEHVFYVQSKRDNCLSSVSKRVKVTIVVKPLPEVYTTGVTACAGSSIALSVDNPVSGITYNWYNLPSGGALQATGASINTPILNSDITYYVEAVNPITGCISSGRSALLVKINPLAAIGITSRKSQLCVGESYVFSNTITGGKWSSSNPLIASVNSVSGEVRALSGGNVSLRYSVEATSGTCANFVDYNVSVFDLPNLSLHSITEICVGTIAVSLNYDTPVNSPVSYSIHWKSVELATIIDQPLPQGNIPISVPSNISPGTYPGVLTIKNSNGCSSQINFNIKINPKPSAPHALVQTNSQY